jgi:hypothetical protein
MAKSRKGLALLIRTRRGDNNKVCYGTFARTSVLLARKWRSVAVLENTARNLSVSYGVWEFFKLM